MDIDQGTVYESPSCVTMDVMTLMSEKFCVVNIGYEAETKD